MRLRLSKIFRHVAVLLNLEGSFSLRLRRGDVLIFSHSELREDRYIDLLTGRHLDLNPAAHLIVERSKGGVQVGEITLEMCRRFSVSEATAGRDLEEFARQADRLAMVQVKRQRLSCQEWFKACVVFLGVMNVDLSLYKGKFRYPPTPFGILKAAAKSFSSLFLISLTLSFLVVAALQNSTPINLDEAMGYGTIPMVIMTAAVSSVIAHELGHLYSSRFFGVPPLFVVSLFGAVFLHFRSMVGTSGRYVAAAGPLAGCAAALFLMLPLMVWLPSRWVLASGIVLAFAHLACLLPWAEDGKAIWQK